MSSYVVAIDLGSTKVVSLVGEKIDNTHFRILAYNETKSQGSIVHGYIVVPKKVAEAVTLTLEQIKTMPQYSQNESEIIADIKEVFINITGKTVKYNDYTTSLIHDNINEIITGKEVRQLESDAYRMRTEAGEEVRYVVPQMYTIDDEKNIFDPEGRLGNKLKGHFHVIVGDQESSKRITMSMSQIGLTIKRQIFDPLASAKATLSEDEKEVGVAIIDIGGGTTKLMVYYKGILKHTTVIPLGGNNITNDIASAFGVLDRDAEKIKQKYGSCMPSMVNASQRIVISGIGNREDKKIPIIDIAKVINARLSEIMDMVTAEISKFQNNLGAGIVLTGGSSKLLNICDFMRMKMKMYVKIGVPEYVSSDSPDSIRQPEYSTVVGLLMYGFEKSVEEDNAEKKIPDLTPQPTPQPTFWQKLYEKTHRFFASKPQEEV